jgi:hypothetical protein
MVELDIALLSIQSRVWGISYARGALGHTDCLWYPQE